MGLASSRPERCESSGALSKLSPWPETTNRASNARGAATQWNGDMKRGSASYVRTSSAAAKASPRRLTASECLTSRTPAVSGGTSPRITPQGRTQTSARRVENVSLVARLMESGSAQGRARFVEDDILNGRGAARRTRVTPMSWSTMSMSRRQCAIRQVMCLNIGLSWRRR